MSDKPKKGHIPPQTFAAVIKAFMQTDRWLKPPPVGLAESTKESYGHTFRLAENPDGLGTVPVNEIRPALVQAFLDKFAHVPAQQKCMQTAFKALEKWAIVRDILPRSITLGTEAPGGTGSNEPWTDAHVRLAELHARQDLARLVTLAANTGQRGSDLTRMRWSDVEVYSGRPGINVIQKKTKKVLWIPMTQELIAAIEGWDRSLGFFVTRVDNGKPFTRPELSDHWLRHRKKNPALAPLNELKLSYHGLRATAVIRLRRAGVSKPLIADMVGMSPAMVDRYCRRSEQRENAMAALRMMEGTVREQAEIIPFKKSP